MSKNSGPQVLTANLLTSGEVLYWRQGRWVASLACAEILIDSAEAKSALEAAEPFIAACVIAGPYLFPVTPEGGVPRPVEKREVIRAAGPSIRPDLGKQAHSQELRHV